MILNQTLENITEGDLQALVDDRVPEGKIIDYKENLPNTSYDSKKEFLADVSSFANAAGGHLIYGIREEERVAVDVCGLEDINVDNVIQDFENMLRDNIEPRIPGVLINSISLQSGKEVVIIYIPRSWAQPHVVRFQRHWRFYSRNSAGKYPLDVSELRAAFALSETTSEKIRSFRAGRLGSIIAGETPIPLSNKETIVLHIVPLTAFEPSLSFDIQSLRQRNIALDPIGSSSSHFRYNFDGILTYDALPNENTSDSYLQIFRNGIFEAVDNILLSPQWTRNPEERLIPSILFEKNLISSLSSYLNIQRQLGITPPFFIMLSLLHVKGYRMAVSARPTYFMRHNIQAIDRNDLILPEIMIEDYESKPEQILKPAFDSIWNASGHPGSLNYNQEGEWQAHDKDW